MVAISKGSRIPKQKGTNVKRLRILLLSLAPAFAAEGVQQVAA
jgi:hypothetical protein